MKSISLAALMALVYADDIPSCGAGQDACPEEYPCCSTEGTCGNGYVCLGGCDARYSHTPGSCVAMPIYENGNHTFNGTDGLAPYAKYLGDAEKNPFSYFGNVSSADDNALRVEMFEGTGASTVSSSYYLWYGKMSVGLKTSGTGGVVSDIILLSNVKDEIDYEFVGYDMDNAQANYYWQGHEDYRNMKECPVGSNTQEDYHEYTIDWQEDKIEWSIDGQVHRTLKKEDTKNETTGDYSFPQTPARIQFGLWPGGDASAQGTSEWAGGPINWDGGQAANGGAFYMDVKYINIEKYDPPSGTNTSGSKSYVYTDSKAMSKHVALTDDDFVLGATDGTGDDLDGPYGHSSSSSSSSSSSATSSSSAASSSSTGASSTTGASSSEASSTSGASSTGASTSGSSSDASSSSSSEPTSTSASDDSSSSSADASSTSGGNGGAGAAAGGGSKTSGGSSSATSAASKTSATSSKPTSSSSSASSAGSSSSAPAPTNANGAGQLVAPLFAAILPAALMI